MRKLLLLLLISLTPLGWAQTAGELVQTKLNALRSMSAHFAQTVTAGKREVSSSSGRMALSRPGRFRWETQEPMAQTIIADSKKLWVYDVELEQITVKKQEKGMGGTAALFLSGYGDTVSRDFNVSMREKNKNQIFDLRAKSPKENYQRLQLTFAGDTLTSLEFYDQLGQHTQVRLTNIKKNQTLPSNLFEFKPPKGVDIIEQ